MITEVSGQATGSQRSGSSGAAMTITYPLTTTTGNLLVLVVAINGGTSVTVSDNKGNTWIKAVGTASGASEIWYCANATGGAAHQLTITPNAASFLSLAIDEFAGAAAASTLDATNSATGNSTTPSVSVTTTNAGDLYIAALDEDQLIAGTFTPGGGWTSDYTQRATSTLEGISMLRQGDGQNLAAGTYSGSWTFSGTSQPWDACIASFKAAASGGGGGPFPWFMDNLAGGFQNQGACL